MSPATHSDEYRALRRVIAQRGTARVWLQWAGVVAWAALLTAVLIAVPLPSAALVPLVVLVTAFELARGLHLGVERIGRYVQVFHEAGDGSGAQWEHVAMTLGPRVPGAAGHPLALPLYTLATAVNGLAVALPRAVPIEWAAVGGAHLAFIAWMALCDQRMRRQRQEEVEAFAKIKAGAGGWGLGTGA